jgi:hypothetical protein
MRKIGIGLAIFVALALVVISVAATRRPLPPSPPLVDMARSAQALEKSGTLMIVHGQTMTQEGQRTGNTDLTTEGQQ